jgi:ABC-type Fe3+-siderophore transport system permease subunit
MRLARNLFFLFTVTAFAVASVILDTFNYNPYEANNRMFINFFVSLFFAVAGIAAFIVYYTKLRVAKDKSINAYFLSSIRQGLFLSAAFTLLVVLRTLQILDWWVAGPTVIAVILLELFFQTNSPLKKQKLNH